MSPKKLLKAHSKSELIRAIQSYQSALLWYSKEENWAVSEERIEWVGSDDPLEIAEIVLGKRKPKPSETAAKKIIKQAIETMKPPGESSHA